MRILLFLLLLLGGAPVLANHPEDDLNSVMAGEEAAFEPLEPQAAPALPLLDAAGREFDLGDHSGLVLAVSFIPADCGAPCAAQQDRLAEVLTSLNASPMRDMVRFITVSRRAEAPEGWENWLVASPAGDETVSDLRDAFGQRAGRQEGAPMIHLLDRDGRQVGIFYGDAFLPLNLVLYINGLTNAHPAPEPPGLLGRVLGWF